MPRRKPAIVAGSFRLVKIAVAPRDTVHLHFAPADVASDPLALMHFSQAVPFGVIIPIDSKSAKKFSADKTYALLIREES